MRVCGILEHEQAVPAGDGHDGVHVGRLAGEVHGDDGARPRCDRGLDGAGVDVERLQVDVHEHRHAVGLDHRRCRRQEGVRRDDHLIAGHQTRGHQRQAQ
jgi:hypothetical protein